jgi:hypothetical protein
VVKSEPSFSPSRERGTDFTLVPSIKECNPMLESQQSNQPQVRDVSQTEVQTVQAEMVRMHQASGDTINANQVEMEQSAAAEVKASSVNTHLSALAAVEAEEVLSQNSVVGFVEAEKASVRGYIGAVSAQNAEIHYSLVGAVVGNDVHVEGARTLFLIGQNVSGNVTTVIEPRTALIAGLTGGLFAGLMLLLGRMLFGRE